MRTKGIHRIKDWTIGRLRRRRVAAAGESEGKGEKQATLAQRLRGWFTRVGDSLGQPRRRTVLRWLTFVFLMGAAYGLWQGSQELIAPDGTLLSQDGTGGDATEEVAESSTELGEMLLGAHSPLPLTGNVAQAAQPPEPERVAPPPLPEVLDLSQVVWPVTGGVDAAYGWYRDPTTEAWRFRSSLVLKPDRDPAPVRASLPGEVISIETSGIGYRVVLAHAEGWNTEYVGLASVDVHVGMRVEAGDTIGEFAAAPHRDGLHYMIRDASGQPTDPSSILYTRTLR